MTNEAVSIVAILLAITVYSIYYFITHFNAIMKKIEVKVKIQRMIKLFSILLLFIILISIFVSFGILLFGDVNQLS